MRQQFFAFLLVLTLLGMATASAVRAPEVSVLSPENEGPQRYIVGFYVMPEDRSSYMGEPVVAVDGVLKYFVVQTQSPAFLQAKAAADARVRYVEWDNPEYAKINFVPNDAKYNDPGHWGSKKIGGEAAWDRTLGSTAVKVAMIDTGLNKDHEEFAGQSRVLQGYDFINGDSDPSDDGGACGWHGTHTTGTAGATINNGKGIAGMSQHTILPIKIFYAKNPMSCPTSTTAIVNALKYAGDQGAHLSSNSWGGGSSSTSINDAIKYAHGKGTTHVAAAGNSGPCTNCVGQPWYDNPTISIIVSASDQNDGFASFSSEGPQVDIIAPGVDILSTVGGTNGYSAYDGTSMATPHVTGVLALVKALNAGYGYTELENSIKSTAVNLGLSGDKQGAGRLNADGATASGGSTTKTAPGAPTLSASAGDTKVDLSWTTPSDGGDPITGYNVYRGTTSGSHTLLASLGVTNAYTDTSVTNGNTYYYVVTAVNSIGEGAKSNEVSATPKASTTTTVLGENFDDGSAQGWTKSSGSTDLWRLASDCVTPASGTYQLAFSRASPDCDYDVGRATGWAATPAMDTSGYGTVTLGFNHFWQVESYSTPYDIMTVQVSSDGGGTWTTIAQWDSSTGNPSTWLSASFDVTSYKSTNFQARWHFDSKDKYSNNYLGWYVDDVVVTGS